MAEELDYTGMTPEEAWAAYNQQQQPAPQEATPNEEGPDYSGMTQEEAWRAYLAHQDGQASGVTSSGPGTMIRTMAEDAPAVIGGLPGAMAGAVAGAPFAGPVGAIVGGIGGAMGGAYLATLAKDWLMEHAGLREGTGLLSEAQRRADARKHPNWQTAGNIANQIAAFGTGTGEARLATRALTGGIGMVQEGLSELYNQGEISPGNMLMAGFAGAMLPSMRKWSARVGGVGATAAARALPARFGEAASKMRIWQMPQEKGGLGNAPEAPPPSNANDTAPVNEGSGGERSEQHYPKGTFAPGAMARNARMRRQQAQQPNAGVQDDINTPPTELMGTDDSDIRAAARGGQWGIGGHERIDTDLAGAMKRKEAKAAAQAPNAEIPGLEPVPGEEVPTQYGPALDAQFPRAIRPRDWTDLADGKLPQGSTKAQLMKMVDPDRYAKAAAKPGAMAADHGPQEPAPEPLQKGEILDTTPKMRGQLRALGWSEEQVSLMPADAAAEVIRLKMRPGQQSAARPEAPKPTGLDKAVAAKLKQAGANKAKSERERRAVAAEKRAHAAHEHETMLRKREGINPPPPRTQSTLNNAVYDYTTGTLYNIKPGEDPVDFLHRVAGEAGHLNLEPGRMVNGKFKSEGGMGAKHRKEYEADRAKKKTKVRQPKVPKEAVKPAEAKPVPDYLKPVERPSKGGYVWLKDEATGRRRTIRGKDTDDAYNKARAIAMRELDIANKAGKQTQDRFYIYHNGEINSISLEGAPAKEPLPKPDMGKLKTVATQLKEQGTAKTAKEQAKTPEEKESIQAEIARLKAENEAMRSAGKAEEEHGVVEKAKAILKGKNDENSVRLLAALNKEDVSPEIKNQIASTVLARSVRPNSKPGSLVKNVRVPSKPIRAKSGKGAHDKTKAAEIDRANAGYEAAWDHKAPKAGEEIPYPRTDEQWFALKERVLEALVEARKANGGELPTYQSIPRSHKGELVKAMNLLFKRKFSPQATRAFIAKEYELRSKFAAGEPVGQNVEAGAAARKGPTAEEASAAGAGAVEARPGTWDFEHLENRTMPGGEKEYDAKFVNDVNALRDWAAGLPEETQKYLESKMPDIVDDLKTTTDPGSLAEQMANHIQAFEDMTAAERNKDMTVPLEKRESDTETLEKYTLSRRARAPTKRKATAGETGRSLKETDPEKYAALKEMAEKDQPLQNKNNEKAANPPPHKELEKNADTVEKIASDDAKKPTKGGQLIMDKLREVGEKGKEMLSDKGSGKKGELNVGKMWGDIKGTIPKKWREFLERGPSGRASARTLATVSEKSAAVVSDILHALDMRDIRDAYRVLKLSWVTPKEFRPAEVQKKLYLAHERTDLSGLTPRERDYYNKWLKPFIEENRALYEQLRKYNPHLTEQSSFFHVHRIRHMDFMQRPIHEAGDPMAGQEMTPKGSLEKRQLNVVTPSTMDRTFKVMEDMQTGKRTVISQPAGEDALTHDLVTYSGGNSHKYVEPTFEFDNGSRFKFKGRMYQVKDAYTPEIEANVKDENGNFLKYHKSLAESVYLANAELRRAVRHAEFIEGLKGRPGAKEGDEDYGNPEFHANATTDPKHPEVRNGNWKKTMNPQFDGWYMSDPYRYVFDDYAQSGFQGGEAWTKFQNMSRRVTKLLFWLPTPHVLNVGFHWYVARGWKWFHPKGYASLHKTGIDAIQSVVSQDHIQNEILDNGGSMFHKAVETEDLANLIARWFGQDIMKRPKMWQGLVDTLGMNSTADLVHNIYKGSRRSMWFANDVMYTQLYMEAKAAGMSPKEAITHVERHFPNYRAAGTIMGSRALAQFMTDPGLNAFGRYRIGVFTSYAHMVKEVVNGTGQQRKDAVGNLMAMGVVAFLMKPGIDAFIQWATGNDQAEMRARGPIALPVHLVRWRQGHEDLSTLLGATMTIPPLAKTTLEAYNNLDWAGKRVIEPGDTLVNQGVQMGSHFATGLVAPLGTVSNIVKKREDLAMGIADALLDIKEPSHRARRFHLQQDMKNRQAVRLRHRAGHAPTLLEEAYNQLF